VKSVKDDEKGLAVSLDGRNAPSAAHIFDRVLVAVGRRPNSAIAGLDTARARVNQRAFIEIDGQRRTAEPTIFAADSFG
jgi:dihydrolipoamide dehydrogenase